MVPAPDRGGPRARQRRRSGAARVAGCGASPRADELVRPTLRCWSAGAGEAGAVAAHRDPDRQQVLVDLNRRALLTLFSTEYYRRAEAALSEPEGARAPRLLIGTWPRRHRPSLRVHAHPDDEASTTGGRRRSPAAGCGRAGDLHQRRVRRRARRHEPDDEGHDDRRGGRATAGRARRGQLRSWACRRLVLLGYHDSGMMGWPQNEDPGAFWYDARQRGGRPPRRRAHGGAPRGRRHLRRERLLRPPRPHPGPPHHHARRSTRARCRPSCTTRRSRCRPSPP